MNRLIVLLRGGKYSLKYQICAISSLYLFPFGVCKFCIRDEFGPRPGPAWPGLGLIEGHFWGLAHLGPGRLILAQVRPGPEKNGPNSTHRDEFRLRPSLARPGPGLIEGHFWGLAHHGPGRAGPGPSSARAGKNRPKLIPKFAQLTPMNERVTKPNLDHAW